MKKILLSDAVLVTASARKNFAQVGASHFLATQLLSLYYNNKDALLAGNAMTAASNVEPFIKAVNGIDSKSASKSNITPLIKDAEAVYKSQDLKEQRLHFEDLSTNLFDLAKTLKLSGQPLYEVLGLMKKAYWMSSSKTIKNPYFGSVMVTCGKVVETLN